MNQKKSPADFIKQSLGREVLVKLNDDPSQITGTLVCLDGALNMVLQDVQQYIEGSHHQSYKKIILRGNNIFYVCPKPINYGKKDKSLPQKIQQQ